MGVNKIFNETGVPDETQIDGEEALACPEAQEWFDGVKTHCVKIEAGQHFRHGKIEVGHRIWKGMARAMLERAGMHIAWWFFACCVDHEFSVARGCGRGQRKSNWQGGKDYSVGSAFRSEATLRPVYFGPFRVSCFSVTE
jgi:hypothetical protein